MIRSRPSRLAPLALSLALCACSSSAPPPPPAPEAFALPKGFLFGTAIAGFQVEMGCPSVDPAVCEDRASDWYAWITDPTLVADQSTYVHGDPPSSGPGFYELYAQDLDRAKKELGSNALRLSIEWSRLFPTTTAGSPGDYASMHALASPTALAWYHSLFAAMKARGLTPLVTIDHYTLPTWLHDAAGCHEDFLACKAKGWADDQGSVPTEMAKYAGFVGKEFGGEVDRWATLNEPFTAVVVAGFLFPTATRTNPPGVFLEPAAAKVAMTNMIVAHARAYDALKAADTVDADGDGRAADVGIVYNLQAVSPDDPTSPVDQTGAKNLAYVMNQLFLDAVGKGDLDANIDGNVVHRDDLANRLDFLGINYYQRATVQGTEKSTFPMVSPLLTFNLLDLQLSSDPEGIYEVITWARRYGVPMYVSETGAQDPNDDGSSAAWLSETMQWVSRAVTDGADVRGYFYWTLMDNYEWNHGMTIKMGLYGVDPTDASKARKARSGVAAYQAIASQSLVPSALVAKYPVPARPAPDGGAK